MPATTRPAPAISRLSLLAVAESTPSPSAPRIRRYRLARMSAGRDVGAGSGLRRSAG